MKEEEVENKSLDDLERMIRQAELHQAPIVIIGGYAVRSYTPRTKRYTKDIDIAVRNRKNMNRLTGALKKIGYQVEERNHQRRTAFRRVEGTPISVNIIVERVESTQREVSSYYGHEPVNAPVASLEDTIILKAEAGRERDIIDICVLLLDSLDSIKPQRLKSKAEERDSLDKVSESFKLILDSIDSKEFRFAWETLMGEKINKNQERELWDNTTSILKDLQG